MIKTFTHHFKNGKKITLSIDLSSNEPKIISDYRFSKEDYNKEFEREYLEWTEKFVMPEIYDNLNEKQIEYFIKNRKKK